MFANIGFPVRPPSTNTVVNGFKLNFSVITYMLNAYVSLMAQAMKTVSNEIYGTKREKSVIHIFQFLVRFSSTSLARVN
jgi:hypothetical protein